MPDQDKPVFGVLSRIEEQDGVRMMAWCPGCRCLHGLWIAGKDRPIWKFDGNMEKPTFSPSLGVKWTRILSTEKDESGNLPHEDLMCHSYIRAGRWKFLDDSTHSLAGHTVDMIPIPY